MLAILNSLNAHSLPFLPILTILVSKFMVHSALSDNAKFTLCSRQPWQSR